MRSSSFCRPILALSACFCAFLVASAATAAPGKEQRPGSPELKESEVTWTTVNRGSLRAIVQPAQDVRLSSRAAGVIQRYAAEEGQMVAKDAPILVLDDDQERAEVAQAEAVVRGAQAELAHAEGEYDRAKPLNDERIFSNKQFAEAKYELEIARSRVAQAEAARDLARVKLANRTVLSPIDGIFLKKSKGVGEAVERFEPVARIIDLSSLEVLVYCDASLFGSLRSDAEISVQVSKAEGTPTIVKGRVTYIDPIIDPASGTFRLRVSLTKSDAVAPGYTAIVLPQPPPTFGASK